MHASARFRLTRVHYEQVYADWMASVSRWRKHWLAISLLSSMTGVLLYLAGYRGILPVVLLAVAAFEVCYQMFYRRRWIADRLSDKHAQQDVEIDFTDDAIVFRGPYGTGTYSWQGFDRVVLTQRGMFLWPQKGIHVYVPDSALTPLEAKQDIAKKMRHAAGAEQHAKQ